MTHHAPSAREQTTDTLLLERARTGDDRAIGELYRKEVGDATRLARILVGDDAAEELAAESFARVLAQLRAGRGPTDDFRAYLQVTIRNGFRDRFRATREAPASDRPWLLDDVVPSTEELVADLDRGTATSALATLPPRWQQVLWHLEVEGRKPAEVATMLDMDARAVSSLAFRAREGLKRAYLDQHLQPAAGGPCSWAQTRLSQLVRGDLGVRAERRVTAHLDDCDVCDAVYLEVDRVNQKLAAWLFPVVLWGVVGGHRGGLAWFAAAAGAGTPARRRTPPRRPVVGGAAAPVAVGMACVVACGVAGWVAVAASHGVRHRDRADAEVGAVVEPSVKDSRISATHAAGGGFAPALAQGPVSLPPLPTIPQTESSQTTAPTEGPAIGPDASPSAPVALPSGIPWPTATPATDVPPTDPTPLATIDSPSATSTSTPEPTTLALAPVEVDVAPDGNQARGPYEVVASTVGSPGEEAATLQITLALDDDWVVSGLTPGDGWDCGMPAELSVTSTDAVTCTYLFMGAGDTVEPLGLRLRAPSPVGPAIKPHGTAALAIDGAPAGPGAVRF